MHIHEPVPYEADQNIRPVFPAERFNGVLIIGDVPYNGQVGQPFSNAHYGTLAGLLRKNGTTLEESIQLNLLPYFPANGFLSMEHKPAIESTLDEIVSIIRTHGVKAILCLGRQSLQYIKRNASGLDDERGAPFLFHGVPTIATYHPKELYIEWHNYPIVEADMAKCFRYAREGWSEPVYDINYQPSYPECVRFLNLLIEQKPYLAMDVESIDSVLGEYSLMTCIGFGINGKKAFVIPFVNDQNKHYFSVDQELVIWKLLAKALEVCRYVGHNALHYDHWFLAYWCKILPNVVDDTMFAHWEVYTEMDKSLAFCNSLYCENPYWKNILKLSRTGKVPRNMEFHYNGLDNVLAMQVAKSIGDEMKELPPEVKRHYKFNVRVSRVFQYMALRGCRINRDLLSDRIKRITVENAQMQELLNAQAGREVMVTSPKKMKAWLYEDLRLPVKTKMVKLDDGTHEDRETADFLALAYLSREYTELPALMTAANLRKNKKRLSSLNAIKYGPNGEVYWNFNLVGTETGRASGYKPYNGMGVQPQNPDRRDRDLFMPGFGVDGAALLWAKCDLEGADAWTVAGQLAKLGDDTMLKDLRAGLKPAQILSLASIVGTHVIEWSQEQLKPLLAQYKSFLKTPEGKQIYETDKAVSHGTNYMMQAPTMHMTVFKKSKGELYIPVKECEKRRLLYLKRYKGLVKLYAHIPTILNSHGYIDCPSGMRRVFFGRADNHRTRVGLSLLPQNNTAYATNRFAENLYYRNYNRRADSVSLIIEPINQVHDELDLAFREDELDQVRGIFTKATDFDSEIWGIHFKIPFEPNYGANWGSCDKSIFADE